MAHQPLDVLVVGGGVVGTGAALDAASRGLRVGLVEASDWAAGTSSRSSKLVHGGLRYLEQLDFALVREALRERSLILDRLAPHLARPVPFLYPLRHRVWERAYAGTGIAIYDGLGGRHGVPSHRHLTKRKALAQFPGLRSDALVGAIRYYDGQVDDARHTLGLARTAVQHGVRARAVVNAAGVWTDELRELVGAEAGPQVRMSKGVHLLIPRDRIAATTGLISKTEKSVLFVIPWDEHWIVGTTDTEWTLDRAHPAVSRADVDHLLDQANRVLARPLTTDDVVGVYAGLRPLLDAGDDDTTRLSREHAVATPVPGLVVVAGGKYTTYRVMARDAVDAAVEDWDGVPASCTERLPLVGADGYHAAWNRRHRTAAELGLSLDRVEHLLRRAVVPAGRGVRRRGRRGGAAPRRRPVPAYPHLDHRPRPWCAGRGRGRRAGRAPARVGRGAAAGRGRALPHPRRGRAGRAGDAGRRARRRGPPGGGARTPERVG